MNALKRLILWEYPRASWQYDVIVGAIVIFVFVTPRFISFGDRPKPAWREMMPVSQTGWPFRIQQRSSRANLSEC